MRERKRGREINIGLQMTRTEYGKKKKERKKGVNKDGVEEGEREKDKKMRYRKGKVKYLVKKNNGKNTDE